MKTKYLNIDNLRIVTGGILDQIRPYTKSYRPEPDPAVMALIIIDMQRFFCEEGGKGHVPSAAAIIPGITELQDLCLSKNIPVFMTRHVNTPEDAGMMGVRWKEIIRKEDPWSEIIPELKNPGVQVIEKGQFDAFYNTGLEERLRSAGIRQLVVTGVMANLCCETTVRSAFVRGFEPVFPVDGTAAYNHEFHLSTFMNLGYGFIHPFLMDEIIRTIEAS